jgi:hypothetical protein
VARAGFFGGFGALYLPGLTLRAFFIARLTLGLVDCVRRSAANAEERVAAPRHTKTSRARSRIPIYYGIPVEKDRYIFTKQYAVMAAQAQAAQRQNCSLGELEIRGVPAKYAVTNPVTRPPICAALSTRK